MGLLKTIFGFLIGAAGVFCLLLLTPFSIFTGEISVMAMFAVLGIILLAVAYWLIRHA